MKKLLAAGVGAIALSFALTTAAEAQLFPAAGSPACALADGAGFDFWDCRGSFDGNNEGSGNGGSSPGENATIDYINAQWGTDIDYGSGMGYTSGRTGDFVLAVKGSTRFSLFYFTGHDGSALDFAQAMMGVSLNSNGVTQEDSHVNVYSVPEPGTMLLLGTGLLGMAMVRRREDDA